MAQLGPSDIVARRLPPALPLVRRLLASASLGSVAVWLISEAQWEGALLGVAGIVGAGAIAIGRRSVLCQVLGRGVAWCALAPASLAVAGGLSHGQPPNALVCFLAAAPCMALLLARPALHTAEARAKFAPLRYRRLFLAGAVASVMAGTSAGLYATAGLGWGAEHPITLGAALAASLALLASAVGVVRMRAWGVLLAIVTAAGSLVAALLSTGQWLSAAFWVTAMPGLLLALPLVLARLRTAAEVRSPPQARLRVASVASSSANDSAERVRVACTSDSERAEPDNVEETSAALSLTACSFRGALEK
jgi:hypothetical protein